MSKFNNADYNSNTFMVDEKQLRAFEQRLLELGDERAILEKEGKRFSSVLDSEEDTTETQRGILQNLITSALESEQSEKDVDAAGEESLTDPTLDEFDSLLKDADALGDISSESLDDQVDDVPVEEIKDNIELIEQEVDDDVVDVTASGDFALPETYQTISADVSLLSYDEVFSMEAPPKAERSTGTSSEVENLIRDDPLLAVDDNKGFRADSQYKSLRSFSVDDEKLFFENLDTYNIVIKKAVFAILTDEKMSHFAEKLVDLIFDSATSQVVHRECEKLLKVLLPSPVEPTIYTHETLSERLYTSSEAVAKSVNIVTRRIIPLAACLVLVVFFGFFFLVQPARAFIYYSLGFHALKKHEYEVSESHFIKASDIWSIEQFYFSYANEYEQQRRYADAKNKYLQLIFGLDDHLRTYTQELILEDRLFTTILVDDTFIPVEDIIHYSRTGFLNLAAFTRDVEGDFEEARIYYNTWLLKRPHDSDFYIELGNTYVEWYDVEQEVDILEQARVMYDKATVLRNNDDTSLIMRMRYAIRAGDDAYIDSLYKSLLFTSDSNRPPFIFVPYVELAMYRLMQHKPSYVAEILDIIKSHEQEYIDLDYLYAQYYAHIGYDEPYQQSLLQAQAQYANQKLLRGKTLYYAIDTNILLGQLLLTKYDNIIYAKQTLLEAQKRYEDMRSLLLHNNNNSLARLYELQAEIAILENDLVLAQEYIATAQEENYESLTLAYQQGVIEYVSQNYYNAAQHFLSIVDKYLFAEDMKIPTSADVTVDALQYTAVVDREEKIFSENKSNVLIATANALYFSGNYSTAALYFEKVLTDMKETSISLANTISYVTPDDAEEISNARRIGFLRNNFGAALYRLSEQQGNNAQDLYSRAMNELTLANRIMQNTYRTITSSNRKIIPNLSEANIEAIVNGSNIVQIYPSILLTLHGSPQRYYNEMLNE